MLLSTSSSLSGRPDLIGVSIAKHRPEHVDASAGERDERLVMTLAFPPLAVVKGATDRVLQGAEGRLVQDALQILIAAERPAEEADFTGLAKHGSEACSGGERVGTGEAGQTACLDEELAGQGDPHPGQAQDEGPVRVAGEEFRELLIKSAQALTGPERIASQLATQGGGDRFARERQPLFVRGLERGGREGLQALEMGASA